MDGAARLVALDHPALPRRPRAIALARAVAVNFVAPFGAVVFGWSALVALLLIYVDAFALVAAVSLVLAVSIAAEDPPGVRAGAARVRYIAAVWGAGVAILGFFPLVGAVLFVSMLGVPLHQLRGDLAAEPAFAGAALAVAAAHAGDVIVRLRGDLAASEREAVDDFSVMLLRAFAFPVAGGVLLVAAAPFGRRGQVAVLFLVALVMTAGDLWRDRWIALLAKPRTQVPT